MINTRTTVSKEITTPCIECGGVAHVRAYCDAAGSPLRYSTLKGAGMGLADMKGSNVVRASKVRCFECLRKHKFAKHNLYEVRRAERERELAESEYELDRYRSRLWMEFYFQTGTSLRFEGIKSARAVRQWVNVLTLDGRRFSGHCLSFLTNMKREDWVDGNDSPSYGQGEQG